MWISIYAICCGCLAICTEYIEGLVIDYQQGNVSFIHYFYCKFKTTRKWTCCTLVIAKLSYVKTKKTYNNHLHLFRWRVDEEVEMANKTPGGGFPLGREEAVSEKTPTKKRGQVRQWVSSLYNSKTIKHRLHKDEILLLFSSLLFIVLMPVLVWSPLLILVLIGRQWLQSNVVVEEDKSIAGPQ